MRLIRNSREPSTTPGPAPTFEREEGTGSYPRDTRASAMLVNIPGIIDDAKCYEMVRQLRCPHRDSGEVVKQDRDETEPQRQRYECRCRDRRFDDLTGTITPVTTSRYVSRSWSSTSWA
jgi:hypothetical protein